jgi:hypothetical protein
MNLLHTQIKEGNTRKIIGDFIEKVGKFYHNTFDLIFYYANCSRCKSANLEL